MVFHRIFVKGIVQGVGFRPYIYRKAVESSLKGYVKNIGNGVEIVINDRDFLKKLIDLPPLAKISDYSQKKLDCKDFSGFSIEESSYSDGETILPPDIFTCNDCLKELKDSKSRRNNYYFITCTNCGPRFSVINDYPYDRSTTSMNEFEMCESCRKEYSSNLDRRYHAQTIACKDCGPGLMLKEAEHDISGKNDIETIKKAVDIIKSGEFLSIKGVGGFHICSLLREDCVDRVRRFIQRPDKPFAIMAKDTKMAEQIAVISKKEEILLSSPQRPIVVLKKRQNNYKMISELDTIGVMLPYTALHCLLFDSIDEPLVMTSCNIPGEPVAIEEQYGRYFLSHQRKIINRCDDSVLKVIDNETLYLRRSRGFTPLPIRLPITCKDTIAFGAELNNVICTAKNKNCFLSQYIGESSKLATFEFMKQAAKQMIKLTRLSPELVVCDLHPAYNSTIFAEEFAKEQNIKIIQIQHHKAHVASVAAEHGLKDYVGIAMDGLGYGEDGKIWGGEVFEIKDGKEFSRIGSLEEQPQIGGDSSVIYPKKMLLGILNKFMSKEEIINLNLFGEKETKLYLQAINQKFNTPLTTSAGRVLDAVSALLNLCDKRTYDGRPAMLLESIATNPLKLEPIILKKDGRGILSTTELFRFLLDNLERSKGELAATAQMYVAKGLFEIAEKVSSDKGKEIVFSGGVAYNRMISGFMKNKGVLFNKEIPCGDGGICYGQAYLANIIQKD